MFLPPFTARLPPFHNYIKPYIFLLLSINNPFSLIVSCLPTQTINILHLLVLVLIFLFSSTIVHIYITTLHHTYLLPTSTMLSFFRNTVTIATLGLLAWAPLASAGFTDDCRNVCLGSDSDNYLVTECTVDGLPTDSSYQWSTLDLNLVLGYNAPNIVYQQKYVARFCSFPTRFLLVKEHQH